MKEKTKNLGVSRGEIIQSKQKDNRFLIGIIIVVIVGFICALISIIKQGLGH